MSIVVAGKQVSSHKVTGKSVERAELILSERSCLFLLLLVFDPFLNNAIFNMLLGKKQYPF